MFPIQLALVHRPYESSRIGVLPKASGGSALSCMFVLAALLLSGAPWTYGGGRGWLTAMPSMFEGADGQPSDFAEPSGCGCGQ